MPPTPVRRNSRPRTIVNIAKRRLAISRAVYNTSTIDICPTGDCVKDFGTCEIKDDENAKCIICSDAMNHIFKTYLAKSIGIETVSQITLAIALTRWSMNKEIFNKVNELDVTRIMDFYLEVQNMKLIVDLIVGILAWSFNVTKKTIALNNNTHKSSYNNNAKLTNNTKSIITTKNRKY